MKTLYESIFDTDFEPTVANTKVKPRSKVELIQIIADHVKKLIPCPGEEVDLNWIDISGVDDLSHLFQDTLYIPVIDAWKIDHVKDFGYMFSGNVYIKSSPLPVLQESLKGKWCYRSMFEGCTSLQVAPKLPAKKLTYYCYSSMFEGCTSLQVAPKLPAMDLAESCYWNMFRNCTSLQVAPELPAMELKSECYRIMFYGCRSLKVAPELPAVELGAMCYSSMFENCKSLTKAPALPAKKLKIDCYAEMFRDCSKLKTKAKLPAGVRLDASANRNMYSGCPCENK